MNLAVSVGAIEIDVGVEYDNEALLKRVEVIDTGAGSAAGGSPMEYGPYGREVWNDDLSGRKTSETTRTGNMPKGFNNVGNQFSQKAKDEMENEKEQIMQHALRHISQSLLDGVIRQ